MRNISNSNKISFRSTATKPSCAPIRASLFSVWFDCYISPLDVHTKLQIICQQMPKPTGLRLLLPVYSLLLQISKPILNLQRLKVTEFLISEIHFQAERFAIEVFAFGKSRKTRSTLAPEFQKSWKVSEIWIFCKQIIDSRGWIAK